MLWRVYALFVNKEIAETVGSHLQNIRKSLDLLHQVTPDGALVAGNTAERTELSGFVHEIHAPHLLRYAAKSVPVSSTSLRSMTSAGVCI